VAIRFTDPNPDTDSAPDPYRDTGKTCLGGGMHCPVLLVFIVYYTYSIVSLVATRKRLPSPLLHVKFDFEFEYSTLITRMVNHWGRI